MTKYQKAMAAAKRVPKAKNKRIAKHNVCKALLELLRG